MSAFHAGPLQNCGVVRCPRSYTTSIFKRFRLRLTVVLPIALAAIGCAHYPPTQRLERGAEAALLARTRESVTARSPELHLLLTFSGGGTRAAALSYGVLEELARIEMPTPTGPRRLVDEVDAISAVSGGSFTAAYYGLYGDRIFEDFEAKFLKANVQGALIRRMLLFPRHWVRLRSRWWGRGDLAAAYYDQILFNGATFEDIWANGGPFIQIQATDITTGALFSFVPGQFELICADLGAFSVARAVAASSAFPGAFTPITIQNYTGQCESWAADLVRTTLQEENLSRRRFYTTLERSEYLDATEQPYIHLMDGGIADNLGVRGPLDIATIAGGIRERAEGLGLEQVKKLVVVVVNAQQPQMKQWGRRAAPPGMIATLGALSGFMLNRYAFETVDLLEFSLKRWADELRQDPRWLDLDVYVVEVNLAALQEERQAGYERDRTDPRPHPISEELLGLIPRSVPMVPTSLALRPEAVDLLRGASRRLLWESREFRRLIEDLGATTVTAAE